MSYVNITSLDNITAPIHGAVQLIVTSHNHNDTARTIALNRMGRPVNPDYS